MRAGVTGTVGGVNTSTPWSEYLRRVAPGKSNANLAKALGLHDATVGRWMNGSTERPAAEAVIVVARRLGQNPIHALTEVGYLDAQEAKAFEIPREFELSEFTPVELAREILRRLEGPQTTETPDDVGASRHDVALAASDDEDWQRRQEDEHDIS